MKLKRLLATLIDGILVIWIGSLPKLIIQDFAIYGQINIIIDCLCLILIVFLFIKKDCIIGYESIGKKIFRLKIYSNSKQVKDKKLLTNRVKKTFYKFPLYPISILCEGKSEGDIEYDTEVN